jgi:hypothetical protein
MYRSKKRCPLTKQSCASDCAWFDDCYDCALLAAIKDFSAAIQELVAYRRQSKTINNGKRTNNNYPEYN